MDCKIIMSSGNIFEDLGLDHPKEMIEKSNIVYQIEQAIKKRNINNVQASQMCGITQDNFMKIINGDFRDVSLKDLKEYLNNII